MNGETADALHRRRQDSDLEDASSDRTDIAAETGIDKVLVNHNKGSAAAVTELVTRGQRCVDFVCSLKGQNRDRRDHIAEHC